MEGTGNASRHVQWILLAALSACTAGRSGSGEDTILVSAAASLREVVAEASESFQQQRAEISIQLNFGASGALRQQIELGAPVDVFISAATEDVDRLVQADRVDQEERRIFARNRLVLIGASDRVRGLEDLLSDAVARVSIGDPRSVPAGKYAREWLEAEGLWKAIESKTVLGGDVRQVLDYVRRGEVDAGIVYRTDAKLLDLEPISMASVPPAPEVVYEVALVVRPERDHTVARDFFDHLGSPTVTDALEAAGFISP
jgi:molybdate transport system substrate-binding protein